jgi:hypothetical protein
MLAFTMQFSRYGRDHSLLGTPSGVPSSRAVQESAPTKRLLPQDPTACSPSPVLRALVPRTQKRGVLAAPSRMAG